jgi:serine/threonine protein kinase
MPSDLIQSGKFSEIYFNSNNLIESYKERPLASILGAKLDCDNNFIDLVIKLLNIDYRVRINADEALKHPFFKIINNKRKIDEEENTYNSNKSSKIEK